MAADPAWWWGGEGKKITELNRGVGTGGDGGACGGDGAGNDCGNGYVINCDDGGGDTCGRDCRWEGVCDGGDLENQMLLELLC